MLARQLHHHPAWSLAGRAAELAAARDRLELMATENLSVAAAFDLSYADLTADQQQLFRRLGLHPGADIDAYAAAALDGTDLAAARRGLEALYDQYLLAEPARAGTGCTTWSASTPAPSPGALTRTVTGPGHRPAAGLLSARRRPRRSPAGPPGPHHLGPGRHRVGCGPRTG